MTGVLSRALRLCALSSVFVLVTIALALANDVTLKVLVRHEGQGSGDDLSPNICSRYGICGVYGSSRYVSVPIKAERARVMQAARSICRSEEVHWEPPGLKGIEDIASQSGNDRRTVHRRVLRAFCENHEKQKRQQTLPQELSRTLTELYEEGVLLAEGKKYLEARELFSRCLQALPPYSMTERCTILYNLGVTSSALRDFRSAAKFYENALKISPACHDSWRTHYNLGVVLQGEFKFREEEAAEHYVAALSEVPMFQECVFLAPVFRSFDPCT